MRRLEQIFISVLCILFGGFMLPASAAMTMNMLLNPEMRAWNLLSVALIALAVSPPVLVAGVRLLFNSPNRYGGLFSPVVLRVLAVFNGILGGAILILAAKAGDWHGVYVGIGFLITTLGAFVLANRRAAT